MSKHFCVSYPHGRGELRTDLQDAPNENEKSSLISPVALHSLYVLLRVLTKGRRIGGCGGHTGQLQHLLAGKVPEYTVCLRDQKSSALTMSMKPDWLKYESAHIILFPFLWWFLDTTSLLSSKSHPPQSLILDFFKIGLLYYMWYFMK